jgi:hypothetical protein
MHVQLPARTQSNNTSHLQSGASSLPGLHVAVLPTTPPSCTRTIRALHHTHLVHAAYTSLVYSHHPRAPPHTSGARSLHLPRVLAPSARSTTHIWCTQLTPPSCTRTIRALHPTHLVHAAAATIPEFRRHVLCRLHSTRTGTVAVTSSWPDQWIPPSLGTLDIAQGGDAIARPRAPGSRTSVSAVACVRVIGRSKTAAAPTVHTLASLAVAVCVRAGPRQSSCTATLTGTP